MIEVTMRRAWSDGRATIGMLTIEGVNHDPIFTLENPERATTVDSRIPAGTYTVVPYSSEKHPNTYLVQNVPGRSYILFHIGNFESDTLGCILIGASAGMSLNKPAVLNSTDAFKKFRQYIGQKSFKLTITA